jgi:branched-chain amino acid transport system substrate-binding protein
LFPLSSRLLLATTAVLTLGLTGCAKASDSADGGNGSGGGDSRDPVTVGVVMAKSGFMSPYDTPALNSLRIEVKHVNDAGGIDGHPIDLQIIDTETKLDRYASAAAELLDKGAKAIIVTCDYDISVPAAQAAQAKNVISIAPCVGDPIFGPRGGLDLGFSMGDGTPGEASIMAEFADSKGWKDAVLLKDTSLKYTQNQCDIVAKRLRQLGDHVIATYNFKQGDSIKETVSKIRSGPKPSVVFNCSYAPGGATAAKELRDGGLDAPIVSGFGMDGDFWTSNVPGLKDYYVVTFASKNGDDPDPAVNKFADDYEKEYGARPDVGGFVTGPTTIQALAAAYKAAGSWDGDKLTAAMESFEDEQFLAGPTSFSPELHINVARPMRVLQVVNGKLAFVEQREPAEIATLD